MFTVSTFNEIAELTADMTLHFYAKCLGRAVGIEDAGKSARSRQKTDAGGTNVAGAAGATKGGSGPADTARQGPSAQPPRVHRRAPPPTPLNRPVPAPARMPPPGDPGTILRWRR